jgi:hypothetical protein
MVEAKAVILRVSRSDSAGREYFGSHGFSPFSSPVSFRVPHHPGSSRSCERYVTTEGRGSFADIAGCTPQLKSRGNSDGGQDGRKYLSLFVLRNREPIAQLRHLDFYFRLFLSSSFDGNPPTRTK